jgi:tetratricopeptide (TPR) repeat protein
MSDAALTISEEPPQRVQATAATPYNAFISYSHVKDKALASALQSAMQRLGKPWYRRRALRLFRDDTSLTATPHLWPSIEKALGQSRFLILMASPEAAASHWVNQELAWWLDHNGPDTVLIALTAGELEWSGETGDFRASDATPLPPALRGSFADEPLWIDLRPYREAASPRDARFTDLAASIAAALHGRPKEDLLSQEVRQQRRALRLAGSAVALLLLLLGLAGWQWTVARVQRNRAEHTLVLATQTANSLVFDLAQKFRDSGVPAAVIAGILDQARKLQDQLTSSGETSPDLRRSQAAALSEVARELLTIGDIKGALAAAQQEQTVVKALLADAPNNLDYQRGVSDSDQKIARILIEQGDVDGALARFRAAEAILAALTAKDPRNTLWQHDLAIGHEDIGDALRLQGHLDEALAEYRVSVAISQALARGNPNNDEWQRMFTSENDRVGLVLAMQGDLAGALAAYRNSLAIIQALAAKNPANTDGQHSVLSEETAIGDALRGQRDFAGALVSYREALGIAQLLIRNDPDNANWRRDLGAIDERIGLALEADGQLDAALTSYRDDVAITQALVRKDPGNNVWQLELSIADDHVGDILDAQHKKAAALAAYREALAIRRALVQKNPNNVSWQSELVVSLVNVDSILEEGQLTDEAYAILKQLDAAGILPANQKDVYAMMKAEHDKR